MRSNLPTLSEELYAEKLQKRVNDLVADDTDPLDTLALLVVLLDKEGKEIGEDITDAQTIAFQQALIAVDMLINSLFEIQKRVKNNAR